MSSLGLSVCSSGDDGALGSYCLARGAASVKVLCAVSSVLYFFFIFFLRILTALFYNPHSRGEARQIHYPENAAFGFRFAAKSDALPCRPTGVFLRRLSEWMIFLLFLGESIDKTHMLLSDKTLKCIFLDTGPSNIKKGLQITAEGKRKDCSSREQNARWVFGLVHPLPNTHSPTEHQMLPIQK